MFESGCAQDAFEFLPSAFQLICCRGAANLDKQLLQIGPGQRDVGCTFVAHRADSAQIGWFVASPGFVDDVPDVQTRLRVGSWDLRQRRHIWQLKPLRSRT